VGGGGEGEEMEGKKHDINSRSMDWECGKGSSWIGDEFVSIGLTMATIFNGPPCKTFEQIAVSELLWLYEPPHVLQAL
jgi:hypothetical protein